MHLDGSKGEQAVQVRFLKLGLQPLMAAADGCVVSVPGSFLFRAKPIVKDRKRFIGAARAMKGGHNS